MMRRRLLLIALLIVAVAVSTAQDISNTAPAKTPRTFAPNLPAPTRQGGDTFDDALPIPAPYSTNGTTFGYQNDYDEACPYADSTAPDVVYSVTPESLDLYDIDMLGSEYDTKIYIYDANLVLIACNDDFYPDYVSKLESVPLNPDSAPYFLVIDGYGEEHGPYTLTITGTVGCDLVPGYNAQLEDEQPLVDGYEDAYNGGCSSPEFGAPMLTLNGTVDINFFGRSGWYEHPEGNRRDTDWFLTYLDFDGRIYVSLDAEYACYLFQLAPLDCDSVAVLQSVMCGPCYEGGFWIEGPPYMEVWLWVGPTAFDGPVNEFDYCLQVQDFTGWPLALNSAHDYPLSIPRIEWRYGYITVDTDDQTQGDIDLADLCGIEPTPGPDLFAEVYLEAGQQVGGNIYQQYYAKSEIWDRMRFCVYLVTDMREWADGCLGGQCAEQDNVSFSMTVQETGWHTIVLDFEDQDPFHAWTTFGHDPQARPIPPDHDDCAGARLLALGAIDISDDLSSATNAVDPGRDGCSGHPELRYTGRDVLYRIDFIAGLSLDVTMTGIEDWEEALYLVSNCEAPLGTCIAAAVAEGDGVRLQYTALESETLWMVCDTWDVGPRTFNLAGYYGTMTDAPRPVSQGLMLRATPNPFNPRATFSYELPREMAVRLRIHALDGRVVATLVDESIAAGRHNVEWTGRDRPGRPVPSGVYLARLEAGGESRAIRVTLVK